MKRKNGTTCGLGRAHDLGRTLGLGRTRAIIAVGVSLGLAACAAPGAVRTNFDSSLGETELQHQYEQDIATYLEDTQHLMALSYGLRRANAETCGADPEYDYGFTTVSIIEFSRASQEAAMQMIPGLDAQPQIVAQAADGAAALGGLKLGDKIVAVSGRDVQTGRWAMEDLRWRLSTASTSGEPVDISVMRGTEQITATLEPALVCSSQVSYIAQDEAVNAYTDGEDIYVTSGMMRFVESDDELLHVIAHEMGHRALGHVDSKNFSTLGDAGRGLIRDFASIMGRVNTGGTVIEIKDGITTWSFTQAFEAEADRAGLGILAQAGHDISGAAEFWDRMGAQDSERIAFTLTHLVTAKRTLGVVDLELEPDVAPVVEGDTEETATPEASQ